MSIHPTVTEDARAAALGSQFRSRRKELSLTQEDLALLAGVSPRFIGDLERGKPTVRLNSVLAVASALGLTLGLR